MYSPVQVNRKREKKVPLRVPVGGIKGGCGCVMPIARRKEEA
jgi:hypothetical protein